MNQKISTDYTAVAVGMISAAAVGAMTGGVGTIAMAGASGAMIGSGAKKSTTSTEMTYDAVQKASELNFTNNLKIESGSDTNITSSNLSANQIDVNAGKITDQNGDLQTINSNANLNVATIADIHIKESSVKKTHANYLAVAATSAAVAGISIGIGEVAATGAGAIGTAVAGEVVGNQIATAMFYAAMAGTSLSMVNGASAASTETRSSSTSTTTQTQAVSNLISVGNLNLLSAKNLNISASNIQTTGSGDINLTSQTGDVNVMAGINSSTTVSSSSNRDFDSIGFSHTHSSVGMDFTQTGNDNTTTVTQTSMASSILSSANNINISSGSSLLSSAEGGSTNILASTLSADNQINITANKELNIKSVEEVSKIVSDSSDVTNTITLSVGNAWLGLADSTVQSARKIEDSSNSKTDDKAKAANATAASAQIGMNILQAIVTAPSFGFYGAVTDTLSKTTTTSETDYITNAASNLYATNDINLTSNSDLTIKGSNIYSENGDINLRSKEGNVNIQAAQNSVNSSSSSETNSISETVSVSGGGIWVSIPTISTSSSSSDLNSTSYLSSTITANNGTININAKEDTNVIGSSILGKDVTITTNNLNVESLQSKLTSNTESDSYSLGGNIGFNNSDNSQDRLWTDNIASIIGTNSVTINTENNTNIIGGVIANSTNGLIGNNAIDGGNLTINTKTLTYSNLNDHNNSESNAIGINVGLPVGFGGSSPNNLSLVADIKNTTLGLSYAANSSDQTGETKATIGQGTINLNSTITRDSTTGEVTNITGQETISNNDSRISNLNRDIQTNQVDNGTHYEGGYNINLSVSFAVLNRAYELHQNGQLLQEAKTNLGGTAKLYGEAAETIREVAEDKLGAVGTVLTAPTQIVEGTIFTFLEEKNSPEGSYLARAVYDPNDPWTYKLTMTLDPTEGQNYAVNGMNTSKSLDGYFLSEGQSSDLIVRYNPTHGLFGDLIESGLTKIFNAFGGNSAIAMERIVTEDAYDRKNIPNATNTFISEGSIIGLGAMQLYSETFLQGVDLNGNAINGSGEINSTQRFVAVAPAVLKDDWKTTSNSLGLVWSDNNYSHDSIDPVRYLTAPSNLISDTASLFSTKINSPVYAPNPLSTLTGIGLGAYDLLNGGGANNPHSISNPLYSKYLRNNQEQ